MSVYTLDHAPPQWAGSVRVTDDLWYCFPDGSDSAPLIWHWCHPVHSWALSGTGLHEVSKDYEGRLTLRPSLWFRDCCGMHGWLTNDAWTPV